MQSENQQSQGDGLRLQLAMIEEKLYLLLQMISDIYEVTKTLGPKVGVEVQPCQLVKAWLKDKDSNI